MDGPAATKARPITSTFRFCMVPLPGGGLHATESLQARMQSRVGCARVVLQVRRNSTSYTPLYPAGRTLNINTICACSALTQASSKPLLLRLHLYDLGWPAKCCSERS